MPVAAPELEKARTTLDAWVRELMQWHFSPDTGCTFWLDWAKQAGWDPRKEVNNYDDLDKFGGFQDEWLRGGPVRRWVPKAYQDKPIYTFETGGSTGVPKSRININDFRIDYEEYSKTLVRRSAELGPFFATGGILVVFGMEPSWIDSLESD